jgi:D-glycero-D-manno-heptose 1,7-bisphosphate phosphatase
MDKKPALFLDRDGTLIEDRDFLSRVGDISFIPGAFRAIRNANESSIPVVLISNQSGIARGLFKESTLEKIHFAVSEQVRNSGGRIDAIYYCPHHPEGAVREYRLDCDCRKPKPGLLLHAAADLGIDLNRSVMIGDSLRDIAAGNSAGCRSVLVLTGNGLEQSASLEDSDDEAEQPQYIASDILQAVTWALEKIREGTTKEDRQQIQ